MPGHQRHHRSVALKRLCDEGYICKTGKGKVFSARHSLTLGLARSNREPRLRGGYAQGLGARSWHMKRQKLSARPTTRWDELMTVR